MLALFLCTLLQDPFQVDGLREGESFRPMASSREVTEAVPNHRYGRVVDAETGLPVPHATIETWTEEISGQGPGLVRVAQTRTAKDGGFKVLVREAELLAEKIRVRAPGYLTFPGTLSNLDLVRLMPKPAWTRRVQVLDLRGDPVDGARITTTYSCAHDVPAFEVVTGPDGIAALPEYGLQDQVGELRVRAEGFAARKYVHWSDVPATTGSGEGANRPAVVRLARQGAIRASVLGRDGRPLPERKLHVIDGDGYHVPTTDERGFFAIEAAYDATEPTIELLQPERNAHVFSGRLPTGYEPVLRVGAADWPAATAVGTITVKTERGTGQRIDLGLFHTEGWALSSAVAAEEPRELEFPAGKVLVSVGQPWGGWSDESVWVTLAEGQELELNLNPAPEVELEILTPPGEAQRVVVEADARSIELEPKQGQSSVYVPRGVAVTVLSEGQRDRRLIVAPLATDGTADLRGESCVLPARLAQQVAGAVRERLEVTLPAVEGELHALGAGDPGVERTGPTTFEVEAPAGYALCLRFQAPGYAECWVTTTTARQHLALAPTPLASLTFENETGSELSLVGPEADAIDGLHPGPYSLFLELEDGRRGMISLDLAPGEQRTLRLHD